MRSNLLHCNKDLKKVNTDLKEIITDGFVNINECYFIKSLYNLQSHINELDFQDKTGYECFINSIHVDDYVEKDFLLHSILLSDLILKLWNDLKNNLILNVIISETDFGYNLKCHIKRVNEVWIDMQQIENFDDAIMLCI